MVVLYPDLVSVCLAPTSRPSPSSRRHPHNNRQVQRRRRGRRGRGAWLACINDAAVAPDGVQGAVAGHRHHRPPAPLTPGQAARLRPGAARRAYAVEYLGMVELVAIPLPDHVGIACGVHDHRREMADVRPARYFRPGRPCPAGRFAGVGDGVEVLPNMMSPLPAVRDESSYQARCTSPLLSAARTGLAATA